MFWKRNLFQYIALYLVQIGWQLSKIWEVKYGSKKWSTYSTQMQLVHYKYVSSFAKGVWNTTIILWYWYLIKNITKINYTSNCYQHLTVRNCFIYCLMIDKCMHLPPICVIFGIILHSFIIKMAFTVASACLKQNSQTDMTFWYK
jgi:hypothetical protein